MQSKANTAEKQYLRSSRSFPKEPDMTTNGSLTGTEKPIALEMRGDHPLEQPVSLDFHLPTAVYGAMVAIWHFRRNLQKRFPLHHNKPRDYLRFLAWCATIGRRKYRILREIPAWDSELNGEAHLPKLDDDPWTDTFTVAQFLFGVAHNHYTFSSLMRDRQPRHKIAVEYWRTGRQACMLPAPPTWQTQNVIASFGGIGPLARHLSSPQELRARTESAIRKELGFDKVFSDEGTQTSHGAYQSRRNLQAKHDVTYEFRPLPPLPAHAVKVAFFANTGLAYLRKALRDRDLAAVTQRLAAHKDKPGTLPFPFGVNLFGHALGELGIGEDIRLVALALNCHKIPFCIVNVAPGRGVSQRDQSVAHWISDEPKYAINLFCMTGFEHVRYSCEFGLSHAIGRYNIGLWPWELPKWPQSCHFLYSLVDEIWGISRDTAHAYKDAPCQVRTMSLPVSTNDIARVDRGRFGLRDSSYVFLFSFDVNSTFARKNPFAVINAFQKAFPRSAGKDVELVIKASHVRPLQVEWIRLKQVAALDRRIVVISEILRKPEVLGLIDVSDCFVSLHRAEGFGRSIAEALAIGKKVIATGYSGNLDFCDQKEAQLVRFRIRNLKANEYFFADHQHWAEPDEIHAAILMRKVYRTRGQPAVRQTKTNPETVGKIYASRLSELRREYRL